MWQMRSIRFFTRGLVHVLTEAVACTAHGLDHATSFAQGFAQAFDVHVYRAFFNIGMLAPYVMQQFRAAVYPFGVLHEIVQQLEFGRSQLDRLPGVLYPVGAGIQG